MNARFAVFADNEFKFIWERNFIPGNLFYEVIHPEMYLTSLGSDKWFKAYAFNKFIEADEVTLEEVPDVYKTLMLLI